MNGLELKGGQASTGPHPINPIWSNPYTRQQKRKEKFLKEFNAIRATFGLFMPRRIQRAIASDKERGVYNG